jgi:hypothetical protein
MGQAGDDLGSADAPALLIHTSIVRSSKWSCASDARRKTDDGLLTSHSTPASCRCRQHLSASSVVVSLTPFELRAAMYTLSPAARNSLTRALPMPLVPPVSTTLRGARGLTHKRTVAARCASANDAPSTKPTAPQTGAGYCDPANKFLLHGKVADNVSVVS